MTVTLPRLHYVVGVNTPGCLPDTAPDVYPNRHTAVTALIDEIVTTTETYGYPLPLTTDEIAYHAAYALSKGEPFTVYVGGYSHFVTPEA